MRLLSGAGLLTFSLQVSLVALGPLSNLALAVRLDPCFPQKLKELYIMGGNMEGDVRTPSNLLFIYFYTRQLSESTFYLNRNRKCDPVRRV